MNIQFNNDLFYVMLFQIWYASLEALLDANERVKMPWNLLEKTVSMTHRETYLSRELFLKLCLIISQSSRYDNVFPQSSGYGLSAKRIFWQEPNTTFRYLSLGVTVIIYWSKTIKWWNKTKQKQRDKRKEKKCRVLLAYRTEEAHYVP